MAPPSSLQQEPLPLGRGGLGLVLTNHSQPASLQFEELPPAYGIKDLIGGVQVQPNALEEAVFSVL